MKFPETQDFIRKAADLIQGLIPYYIKQGKGTLVIAFGCTGGQHRSVGHGKSVLGDLQRAGL